MGSGPVHCYESWADYLLLGEPGYSPDAVGCINILTPKRFVTPTSTGMASNSCLIHVQKWEREINDELAYNARLGGIAP